MCQQHPQFLTAYRLHMHRTVKPSPHHLRNTARIVAVRLVDLRLQHRLHVPRLNADHRQSCIGESAEQPLRQRSSLQPNSLEVVGGVLRYLDKYVRGSNGYDAVNRVKVMKLLWEAIGSEFGSRHELY